MHPRARTALAKKVDARQSSQSDPGTKTANSGPVNKRNVPPFIAAHDIARGVLHAGQMAVSFAFMLAVMYVFRALDASYCTY